MLDRSRSKLKQEDKAHLRKGFGAGSRRCSRAKKQVSPGRQKRRVVKLD